MGTVSVYNVRDYGATGNGSTDDAQAINNALSAAAPSAAVVYFPPGNYAVRENLVVGATARLVGDGYGSVISGAVNPLVSIQYPINDYANGPSIEGIQFETTSGNSAILSNTSSYAKIGAPLNFTNCAFRGTTSNTGALVSLTDASGVWFTNCSFSSAPGGNAGTGLQLRGVISALVTGCQFYFLNVGIEGTYDDVGSAQSTQGLQIVNCYIIGCNTGYHGNYDDGTLISATDLDTCQRPIFVSSGANIVVSGCYIGCSGLGNGSYAAIDIDSATNVTIVDNQINNIIHAGNNGINMGVNNGVTNATIRGNTFDNEGAQGSQPAAAYNVIVNLNKLSNGIIESNSLYGNATGLKLSYNLANFSTSAPYAIRNNAHFNPVGAQPIALPASGTTISNPLPFDCNVVISAGSSSCGVSLQGSSVGTIPANGILGVFVPVGGTISLSYSGSPSWKWSAL